MNDATTIATTIIKQIEQAVAAEIDRLLGLDDVDNPRIRDHAAFRWLTLNNLRLRLTRLGAQELAALAELSGPEILARHPGPAPTVRRLDDIGPTP